MNDLFIYSVLTLSGIGAVAASILFVASKKFKVFEDPKIDEVEEELPSANCGACGFPGCRGFAEAIVNNPDDFDSFNCPVGGNDVMKKVAAIMGKEATEKEPTIAVLKCNGSRQNAPQKIIYSGEQNCALSHSMFSGESGCPSGCLGLGDCVDVCNFGALYIDEETWLPVVDEEKCTSCGACVNVCPRGLFEIMPRGKDNKRIYVACMNTQKGAAAKKNCKVACIGCMKCTKVYETDSVKVTNFCSYISPDVDVENYGSAIIASCPTKAILGVNVEEQKV